MLTRQLLAKDITPKTLFISINNTKHEIENYFTNSIHTLPNNSMTRKTQLSKFWLHNITGPEIWKYTIKRHGSLIHDL